MSVCSEEEEEEVEGGGGALPSVSLAEERERGGGGERGLVKTTVAPTVLKFFSFNACSKICCCSQLTLSAHRLTIDTYRSETGQSPRKIIMYILTMVHGEGQGPGRVLYDVAGILQILHNVSKVLGGDGRSGWVPDH